VKKLSLHSVKGENFFFDVSVTLDLEVEQFDFTNAFTSYSDFFKKNPSIDIYSGDEEIPFGNRDPEFKKMLLCEFL
jgi:hypothetical protein